MQRIPVPMIGGMIPSTVLTLIVVPAVYAQVQMRAIRKQALIASVVPESVPAA